MGKGKDQIWIATTTNSQSIDSNSAYGNRWRWVHTNHRTSHWKETQPLIIRKAIDQKTESGKYLLRSANNGIAAIINPLGVIEQKVEFGKSGYVDFKEAKKIKPNKEIKVPQMGWNRVITSIDDISGYYYFANSYYTDNDEHAIGHSYYGKKFNSIVKKDNFFGCQFHPEKSSDIGEKFIKNFINLVWK